MLNRRVTFWATIMLIAVLSLAACAPRSGQGSSAAGGDDQLVIDLPALVIDIMVDGSVSVSNMSLGGIAALAGQAELVPSFPPDTVDWMTASNIQHIQVSNTPGGLLLLVNGQSVPSVRYDGESLSATADALSSFGMAIPAMDKILGLVDQIGIGVIARFPVAEGSAAIPLYMEGDSSAAMAAKAAQEEFLASVGTPPRINLPIFYEADGSFSIGDLSIAEMNAMTDYALAPLAMTLGQLGMARMLGISQLGISTNVDGITISIDGNSLPTLDWSDGKASNLLELITTIPVLDMAMPGMGSMLPMINQILPLVQATEFDLTLHF
jgi:hypothetical protein